MAVQRQQAALETKCETLVAIILTRKDSVFVD